VRVWSHNAYWFQGAPSLWGQERQVPHPDAVSALTQLYASLRPDVLCLQEVPSGEVAADLGRLLGMRSYFAPGGERVAYGGAFLWRGDRDGQTEDFTSLKVSEDRCFERICMKLTLETASGTLAIVNVHLSSNRFAPGGNGHLLRRPELDKLFSAAGLPHVVAGDFNATFDSTVCEQMRLQGYGDPHQSTGHVIDYVWIREPDMNVTEPLPFDGSFHVPGHSKIALSDHRPVGVRIQLKENTDEV
jgi:endonuclease/exonuclease/phosphatase family metal-dependent hydrolase